MNHRDSPERDRDLPINHQDFPIKVRDFTVFELVLPVGYRDSAETDRNSAE